MFVCVCACACSSEHCLTNDFKWSYIYILIERKEFIENTARSHMCKVCKVYVCEFPEQNKEEISIQRSAELKGRQNIANLS